MGELDNQNIRTILQKLSAGQIALFLGAGVNKGSLNSKGEEAPTGAGLANLIKDQFFPDNDDLPMDLATICEYVELRFSRQDLNKFMYEILDDFKPSKEVLGKIPQFRWKRIFTTNFDRMLEAAYEATMPRVQNLYPIYSDRDSQDYTLGPDTPYFKLHGCITKITDPSIPLVLTRSDYHDWTENRIRLFNRLKDDLYEPSTTFLFIGYSLQDNNFDKLVHEVQGAVGKKYFPRCYAIAPSTPEIQKELWDARKITILEMTAQEFFLIAKKEVPKAEFEPSPHQQEQMELISQQTKKEYDLSLLSPLFRSCELVTDRLGTTSPRYEDYYRGSKPDWSIISNECDASRTIYEQIMDDVLLVDDLDKAESFEFVLITAEAGAGKTTLLMRLAYDHACDFEGLCLFHESFRKIAIEGLEELHRINQRRIYIYVDDVADNIGTLAFLHRRSKALELPITVIGAERKNEWNHVRDSLADVVVVEYDLPYLDDDEIDNVLKVLEEHDYLCELDKYSKAERQQIFREKSNKQLLVAMREATEGEDFDKIIQDEYKNIPNELARRVYLQICALHRFGIPVRAGLLSRISGVPFTEFEDKLFSAWERVVDNVEDAHLGIMLYQARHPHIAEIVCHYALNDPESIMKTYMNILDSMDLGYQSDYYAFRQLVKANQIIDAMPNMETRRLFYDTALELSRDDSYVYQQYGLTELRFDDIDTAERYLHLAYNADSGNPAYTHSYAKLLFDKSQQTETQALRDRLFGKSQELNKNLIRNHPSNDYAYNSYALNLLTVAKEVGESLKQDYIEEAHEVLQTGIRRCFCKDYLLVTEAKLLDELGDRQTAIERLRMSYKINPSSTRTALLLARLLEKDGEIEQAFDVLSKTVELNRFHETLNYQAAKMARKLDSTNHGRIIKYLRRAFDPKFIDLKANFLLAVEYFKSEEYSKSGEIWKEFRRRKPQVKDIEPYKIREDMKSDDGSLIKYKGVVKQSWGGSGYGYIEADLFPDDIYFSRTSYTTDERFRPSERVEFSIGFNYFGPIALDLVKIGGEHSA